MILEARVRLMKELAKDGVLMLKLAPKKHKPHGFAPAAFRIWGRATVTPWHRSPDRGHQPGATSRQLRRPQTQQTPACVAEPEQRWLRGEEEPQDEHAAPSLTDSLQGRKGQ
jgi:hypothetical protein